MTEAIRAWLLAQLGAATDLTDLEYRYARLGTARAVAIEVLYERIAKLRTQPTSVNLSGVVAVSYTENIKAYERQIAALESGQPPSPDDPAADPTAGDIGTIHLIARARR
ncbi:hypothetical protein [Streptomyces sp. NPDC006551]|uniref:hypothetical protein n=1 Tax=Streptomyces sp. NPDC006551 TaxID=3157178 RepID=UPI0033B54284